MDIIECVIEISKGGRLKYEIDDKGNLILDRVIPSGFTYPENYGFIKNTLANDGDALDVLVMTDYKMMPGCIVQCKPIGVLIMTDEKGLDEKILAVPAVHVDSNYEKINSIKDIPQRQLQEIKFFFETYKVIDPNKWSKVKTIGDVHQACELIKQYGITKSNYLPVYLSE